MLQSHLSDLFERLEVHVGKDVALGQREDLKGHGAVVVLQGRDVVVAHRQLRAGIDLVADTHTHTHTHTQSALVTQIHHRSISEHIKHDKGIK